MNHFHFSIGPVQSFIGQARRTRDLWAGSFLLSWLSGVAMAAVRAQDPSAQIIFPVPVDGVMKRIAPAWPGPGDPLPDDAPLLRQGSVPNRFMASVAPGFDGRAVADAVRRAFTALADQAWQRDFAGLHLPGWDLAQTQAIWQRQVSQFWDIAWVIDTEPDRRLPLLDMRKNWRSHYLPTEPGVKCLAMDGWQELSGATGPGDPLLRGFWAAVHGRVSEQHANDLQADEWLSAMAWIKRRLTRVFNRDFRPQVPVGRGAVLQLAGWALSGNVPSVAYVAAAPWLAGVTGNLALAAVADAARGFAGAIGAYQAQTFPKRQPLTKAESETRIQRVVDAGQAQPAPGLAALADELRQMDGSLFFRDDLVNPRLFATAPARPDAMAQALAALCKAAGDSPSSFYAVLRMDGDRIGARMGHALWRPVIARALNAFTQRAVDVTQRRSGFLIYAGGDDVLAFFPVDEAVQAAADLADAFAQAFAAQAASAQPPLPAGDALPTLSGAIVFAQTHVPLASVVQATQNLLDGVAKARAQRNALAVQVVKPGGVTCTWALKWPQGHDASRHPLALQHLASSAHAQFSSGFLGRLRELHEQWFPEAARAPGRAAQATAPPFDEHTTHSLLLAELMGTRRADGGHWTRDDARTQLDRLLPLLTPPWGGAWQADGAVLLKFLSQKGRL